MKEKLENQIAYFGSVENVIIGIGVTSNDCF